ncbi:MAG: hypothetical protein H9872_10370 [Candidatus Cellulosilyticum pullistercoris]|uniref:DUF5658 domain-containing protein n=1 Tax=Candidatus Cellulosilyticum pullistercoris TaxID=2838521 RepID=A0A9E2KDX9_9FIRM|nr:hypothetical protein [Candidatus Cellulosilyticum pullistercoris]
MKQTTIKTQKQIMTVFLLIYILNCTDLLFTYTYLKTGIFFEFNPIMSRLLVSPYLTILVKIILPAIFIIYFFFRLKEHSTSSLILCKIGGMLLILAYTFINSLHLYYLIHFLSLSL